MSPKEAEQYRDHNAIPVTVKPVLQLVSIWKEASQLSETPSEGGAGTEHHSLSSDILPKSLTVGTSVNVEYFSKDYVIK